ncbi:hypothetical protein [Ideonella sp.]|uniref:hypothetical protein n=1 Tax=Ideonella sp. TaxID=1929293 RepID=UPI002B4795F2|nr:hypothetical protein [Ideonella sp.]HJV70690.1 hypothetical protein [Ideonella sp.]
MKSMTRKQFLGALGGGTVVLWLQACGGGGGSDGGGMGGGGGGGLSCGAGSANISANHGHSLTINEADLDSTTNKTYSIMGSAGHDHTVTFTPDQLAMLKGKQSVTVTSTTTSGHNHTVTASCA